MKVLVALAVCLAVAQAASTNFYQPISFQPNQQPIAINPSLPEVGPLPAPELNEVSPLPAPETIYHEINVPHYDGAPLVIIKVNVVRVEQPEPQPEKPIIQTLPAFLPADYLKPVPAFSPADLVKPAIVFSPGDLVKPALVFNPSDLVKPLLEDDYAPAVEVPFENEFAPEHMPQVQAGPLVKIIVNIEN